MYITYSSGGSKLNFDDSYKNLRKNSPDRIILPIILDEKKGLFGSKDIDYEFYRTICRN